MHTEIKLTSFQQECLRAFEKERNVLVVAPSSAGKTFVTKYFLYKYFQQNFGKFLRSPRTFKVAFLFPYKSLAIQEFFDFQRMLEDTGIKVLLAVGGVSIETEDLREANIIVGTYEKFLFLLRRSTDLKKYLKFLAIDEFHFIGSERGIVLEEIILEAQQVEKEPKLILLSSSIANSKEIAGWLNAKIIKNNTRPIPLTYKIVVASNYTQYFHKELKNNNQIIVFCPSRTIAEQLANELSLIVKKTSTLDTDSLLLDYLLNIGKDANKTTEETYIPPKLIEMVNKGIAYHHAGLNEIVRLLIEQLFLTKKVNIIFSTSTLAAGINLPAEKVFFLVPKRAGNLDNNLVFQTLGRAGRLGLSDKGEGINVVNNKRKLRLVEKKLFSTSKCNTNLEPRYNEVLSSFGNYENLAKYLLTILAQKDGTMRGDFNILTSIFAETLWFYQNKDILAPKGQNLKLFHALFSSVNSPLNPDEILNFYELFDTSLGVNKGRMQITTYIQEGSRIRAIVKERSKIFQVYLSLTSRKCSCQHTNSNFLCRHQRFIFYKHPELKTLLNRYGIVDYLIQNGFIVRSRGNNITLTKLGWLTVKYNLFPKEMLEFLEFNANSATNTINQYLHKIITTYSFFMKERKSNELSITASLKIVAEICRNTPVHELCERFHISDATVENWKEHINKMLFLFIELSSYQGRKEIKEKVLNYLRESIA